MQKTSLIIGCVVGIVLFASFSMAESILTENFDGLSGSIPSTSQASFNYWIDDGTLNYIATNSLIDSENANAWPAGKHAFITRSLKDGELIATDEKVKDIEVSFVGSMVWGTDGNTYYGSSLEVLDDAGNGYVGDVRRSGELHIYRVDANVLTEIAYSNHVANGNSRLITMSVVDGRITLVDGIAGGGTLTVTNLKYRLFDTVGFGGRAGIAGEKHQVDDATVSGIVTNVILTENFDGLSGSIPSTPQASFNYWIDNGTLNYIATGSFIDSENAGDWPADSHAYITRSLKDGGLIVSDEKVKDIEISFVGSMQWGTDDANYYGSSLEVLDDAENGYAGDVRRSGELRIYRVDAGVPTQIAYSNHVANGNERLVTMSVANGQITLVDGIAGGGTLSVTDSTYSLFDTVGFGGKTGAGAEKPQVDDVTVTGTIYSPIKGTVIFLK